MKALTLALTVLLATSSVVFAEETAAPADQDPTVSVEAVEITEEVPAEDQTPKN